MRHLTKAKAHHIDACTQFSIAMVFDKDVNAVARQVGGWHPMSTAEMRNYLVRAGLSQTGESVPAEDSTLEGRGILIIHGYGGNSCTGHAVAYENGKIFDSNGKLFDGIAEVCAYYTKYTPELWVPYVVFEAKPLKYREWAIKQGNQNEEVAL